MKKILSVLLILFLFASCHNGISTSSLADEVREDINESFHKQAQSQGVNYEILDFTLVHKGANEYNGILETVEDGENFTYEVDVTVDGENFIWKIVE